MDEPLVSVVFGRVNGDGTRVDCGLSALAVVVFFIAFGVDRYAMCWCLDRFCWLVGWLFVARLVGCGGWVTWNL